MAVRVKTALPPSVTPLPALMLISGVLGGGSSSSDTVTVAEPLLPDTVYPLPEARAAVTDPSASSVLSPAVATVKVAVPEVPTVTDFVPVATP